MLVVLMTHLRHQAELKFEVTLAVTMMGPVDRITAGVDCAA
jgi:hypothetical protein